MINKSMINTGIDSPITSTDQDGPARSAGFGRRRFLMGAGSIGLATIAAEAIGTSPAFAAAHSQNGWPVIDPQHTGNLTTIKAGNASWRVHKGDVATILSYVANLLHHEVEGAIASQCSGWAYRAVRGESDWSNHASGTAIDFNSAKHPLAAVGTWGSKAAHVRAIVADCDGVVRWGGDYHNRKDEMHFEINVGPGSAAVHALAEKIKKGGVVDKGVSAVALPQGGLAVFARNNTNGRLSCRYRNAKGTWTDWIDRDAGILGSGPDATSRVNGTYDIVARRTDGMVILKSKTTKAWQDWRVLAGGLRTNYAPAIVTYNSKTIFVFAVRASDGALMSTRWHSGDGYGPWRKVGNNTGLTSGPDAAKINSGTIAVAFRGPTGNIRIAHWTPKGGWTGAVNWGAPAGGTAPGSAPAIASRSANSVDVMVRDKNGTLHRKLNKPSSAWSKPPLAKVNYGPDLVANTAAGDLQLFARNSNGTPVTATWNAGKGWKAFNKI